MKVDRHSVVLPAISNRLECTAPRPNGVDLGRSYDLKVLRQLREMRRESRLAWKVIRLYRNWPIVFCDRLRLVEKRPIVYQLRGGVELSAQTQTRDRFIINEIFIDQVYTDSPGFTIRDGWVIADIGGHKGIFTVFAATRAKDVKIYSFEPAPENFARLSHNVQRNRLSNVRAFNVAVGGKDGESSLHLHREAGQNSLLQRSDTALQPIGHAKVETWSLVRVLKTIGSPVDLLKMDIEGMEYDTLFSCPPEDLRKVERIALEYHDKWVRTPYQVSNLVDFLDSSGFRTHLSPGRSILVAKRE